MEQFHGAVGLRLTVQDSPWRELAIAGSLKKPAVLLLGLGCLFYAAADAELEPRALIEDDVRLALISRLGRGITFVDIYPKAYAGTQVPHHARRLPGRVTRVVEPDSSVVPDNTLAIPVDRQAQAENRCDPDLGKIREPRTKVYWFERDEPSISGFLRYSLAGVAAYLAGAGDHWMPPRSTRRYSQSLAQLREIVRPPTCRQAGCQFKLSDPAAAAKKREAEMVALLRARGTDVRPSARAVFVQTPAHRLGALLDSAHPEDGPGHSVRYSLAWVTARQLNVDIVGYTDGLNAYHTLASFVWSNGEWRIACGRWGWIS